MHVIYRLTIGGLENGVVNLINTMSRHRYRHAIVCLEDSTDFSDRIEPDDVEVREMHKSRSSAVRLYGRLFSALSELRPSIVHTRNLGALDAIPPALFARIPHRVHGEHGWHSDDLGGENKRHRRLRQLYKPMISQYVTVSAHLAAYLRDAIGVRASKIVQIYNGVDQHRFRPGKAVVPRAGFADGEHVVIGTVGQLRPEKNQRLLIDAFAKLARRQPRLADRLRLVIVGDGPGSEALQRQAEATGLGDQIWLAGARHDVPDLLRSFDVFVLPSKTEGISNTILEAMSSGLPVVATDVGGNGELIVDGQTGLLVPADDSEAMAGALERYLTEPVLRTAHGEASRARVLERFSLDAMVGAYTELYDSLLSR